MSIELFEHNQKAYISATKMLHEKGKAAIVHPTGTGKSFIGFKLCENNPHKIICWLSPSEYIFKTQLENLSKAADGYTPNNIRFITYAKLMNMSEEEMDEIQPDYIILDEFHRCGAEQWGAGVNKLLHIFTDTPVLGLSATAIRYLDNQRDMSDELFDGNIASEMTLGEAIVRGILNPPKYVLSVFSYQKDLESYQKRVHTAKSKAVRDAAAKYLEALRRALEKADGLDVIFDKHMTERTGKYIVFCANVEHMREMIKHSSEWFSKVDGDPHIYTAYSDNPETSKAFLSFKKDNSNHLKLLYCIDMLNEGVHVDDISGVILLRPTVSPIIYKQQIGRALAAGKKTNAVIFDIVLNIENLYSIGAIEEEMQIATTYYRSLGEESKIINEHFKIIDELRDCKELFAKLNDTLSASWELMYDYAKQYYEENGDLNVPKRLKTENGLALGSWIETQRKVYNSKINGILTDKQIKKLESIGMRWESIRDLSWEKYYGAAREYYAENGNLMPSVTDHYYKGIKLSRWIAQLRTYRKSNICCKYLTPERIKKLDEIGMVWNVPDYIFEKNYSHCLEYYKKHGDLDVPLKYIAKDGTRLGSWINGIRCAARNPSSYKGAKLTAEQKSRLDEIGFIWEPKKNVLWNQCFEALVNYKKKYGNLDVHVAYMTEDGIRLGRWVRRQRSSECSISDERKKLLSDLGFVWDLPDPWEEKFKLVKQYYDEHGNANVPGNYVAEGVWIGRWLSEQVARMNKKATGRSKSVKLLTESQVEKLMSLGIKENTSHNDIAWEEQYEAARQYYVQNGNLLVKKDYVSPSGKNLGRWLQTQRKYKKENKLSPEKTARLDALRIVWSYSDAWEIGYRHAIEYYAKNANLNVPVEYVCEDNYNLGKWLSNQKVHYNNPNNYRALSNEQIKRLKDLGIIWNCESVSWETAFNYAVEYSKEHGTLQMPCQYKNRDGFCLGNWIRAQRKKKIAGTLSAERIKRLESIGMDWISKRAREWEIHFENSKIYFEQHGNLNMPTSFVDDTGFNLGSWVRRMEKEKSKLKVSGENGNQIARLEKIGIRWE